MFDFVTRNKRLIQVILAIIFLPFAFFGVDAYFRGGGSSFAVARVGNSDISQDEFSRALRERQDAIRRLAEGGAADPAMLDSPELRFATLDALVQRRLLLDGALRAGVSVGDDQLQRLIGEQQLFQDESGRFSAARYEQFLRTENMTPVQFEARVRQDMMLRQFTDGFAGTLFVPRTIVERLARISGQRREVSHAAVAPEKFLGQVKLDADAARKYYDANAGEFRIPEQVRVEYVVLSADALARQAQLDPAEVRKWYEANRGQFEVKESRQASHILLAVESGASPETKQKARAQADAIYRQALKSPGSFAELAKRNSQDPGSAAKGGDIGFITRGSMADAPEFEETLFKLKPGEISPPVESRLGFHIIRLVRVQPAQVKPFEEVRAQIEKDLGKQLAGRKFAELADGFNNAVYEQSESLKPAADLVKTAPQTSGWLTRAGAAEPLLNNPRLLAAIFSDEALKNKRNTEAIEVAPGTLVAARVGAHQPESVQPFEEIRGALEKRLAQRAAARLAAAEGRRLLDELRQGKTVELAWSAPQLASLAERKGLAEEVAQQAFRADVSKLPAYAGMESSGGGYTLVRVSRVEDPAGIPEERAKAVADNLSRVLAQESLAAYLASLKQKAGVTINKEQLERKN